MIVAALYTVMRSSCILLLILSFIFQLCVDRLMDTRTPSLDTVKMQVYFDMNYTTRCKLLLTLARRFN
jgi:hypothetical protein